MPTKNFHVLKKVYEKVRLLKNLEIYFERIINNIIEFGFDMM